MVDSKKLSISDWRLLLDNLLRVQPESNLRKMHNIILKNRVGDDSEKEIKDAIIAESSDLEFSRKEKLAIEVFDLIGGKVEKPDLKTIKFFGIEIDLTHSLDLDLQDSIKNFDLLVSNSVPSLIEAHYREIDEITMLDAIKRGAIDLSDGKSKIFKSGNGWDFDGDLNEDQAKALGELNDAYLAGFSKLKSLQEEHSQGLEM